MSGSQTFWSQVDRSTSTPSRPRTAPTMDMKQVKTGRISLGCNFWRPVGDKTDWSYKKKHIFPSQSLNSDCLQPSDQQAEQQSARQRFENPGLFIVHMAYKLYSRMCTTVCIKNTSSFQYQRVQYEQLKALLGQAVMPTPGLDYRDGRREGEEWGKRA